MPEVQHGSGDTRGDANLNDSLSVMQPGPSLKNAGSVGKTEVSCAE